MLFKQKNIIKCISKGVLITSFSALTLTTQSDDTEIYLGNSFTDLKPNVLFIMDLSGSMSWSTTSDEGTQPGEESRLDVVKRIAIDTVNNTEDIKLGLMSFNSDGHGSSIDIPLAPIETIKTQITETMSNYTIQSNSGTPITESIDEAIRYFSGDQVLYGSTSPNSIKSGSRYIKPVSNQCQKNHIILFSDGEPTNDGESNNDIRDEINRLNDPRKAELANIPYAQRCSTVGGVLKEVGYSGYYRGQFWQGEDLMTYRRSTYNYGQETSIYGYNNKNGICAEELALTAQLKNISGISGVHQNITIHTVGGFVGGDALDKLKNIAKFGSPAGEVKQNASGVTVPKSYYAATTSTELAEELGKLFNDISSEGSTYSAPSVSVNAYNSLELSDELYYALFEPDRTTNWSGNLKRYRLEQTATGTTVLGQDGQPAVNDATTLFKEDAISFWAHENAAPDGAKIAEGGIAQHLTLPRKVKTIKNNRLRNLSTTRFNKTALNIAGADNSYRIKLIEWAQGVDVDAGPGADGRDVNGELIPRLSMGDPLHSEPTIITYSSDSTNNRVKRSLFLGTNSGFLHAFDIDENNPREHFSFIPKELITNIKAYYEGGSFYDNKTYGLDGPLTHWHDDTNGNGQVDGEEHVYLYITMRRGGQSLYALDVTDPDTPSLLWQKHGDYPSDFHNKPAISNGYEKIGQTWARLEPASVLWEGQNKTVLFTAGGYDPVEDGTTNNGPSNRSAHTLGTTIYMIDAISGEVLWDASEHSPSSAMTSSFAANVSPVDTTGDGLANIIFAADTGGRIWRFDINAEPASHDADDFATSHLVADISSGSGNGNRRFFNEVDVVYKAKSNDILLSVGSGYRAHPLSVAVTNYHYMIRTTIDAPDPTHARVTTHSDLQNWGAASVFGWKIPLTLPGEKVLALSNTSTNTTLFTTFAPKSSNASDLCSSDPGIATLYVLNDSIHRVNLIQGGIPSTPAIIRNKNATTAPSRSIVIGNEVINLSASVGAIGTKHDNISRDYWLETK